MNTTILLLGDLLFLGLMIQGRLQTRAELQKIQRAFEGTAQALENLRAQTAIAVSRLPKTRGKKEANAITKAINKSFEDAGFKS